MSAGASDIDSYERSSFFIQGIGGKNK